MLHSVSGRQQHNASNVPLGTDLQRWGCLVALFNTLRDSLCVLWCGGWWGDGAGQTDGRERRSETRRGRLGAVVEGVYDTETRRP